MPMTLTIETVKLHVHETKRLVRMNNSLFNDLHKAANRIKCVNRELILVYLDSQHK